jgi:hypothetical protein
MHFKKFIIPLFFVSHTLVCQNKENPKNRLDEKYTPSNQIVELKSKSSYNTLSDEYSNNLIFFDLGPLVRSTFLLGYERRWSTFFSTNFQIGSSGYDRFAKIFYPLFQEEERHAGVNSLLANAYSAAPGMALAIEVKLMGSDKDNSRNYVKLGFRRNVFNITDNRSFDYSTQNANGSRNNYLMYSPITFPAINHFFYLGLGSHMETSSGNGHFYHDYSFSIAGKFTRYDAKYETKDDFLSRINASSSFDFSNERQESIYTGGQFGEQLKSSSFIFMFSYKLGFGFK